jgi:hypothetical protein
MKTSTQPTHQALIDRLLTAQNQHDLDSFLACFDPDYQSEQPVHPDCAFQGRAQVHKNWSALFSSVPDFRSDLLGAVSAGDTVWVEWCWSGIRVDGTRLLWQGVTLFGVVADRITWGRLYMEPVQEPGTGIDETVTRMTKGSES